MRLLKLIPDDTNVDFMRWRKVGLAISLLLVLASIALVATRGINFGVDFVGGQQVRATFTQPPPIDDIRNRVQALGLSGSSIQEFGNPNTLLIRTALPKAADEAAIRSFTVSFN